MKFLLIVFGLNSLDENVVGVLAGPFDHINDCEAALTRQVMPGDIVQRNSVQQLVVDMGGEGQSFRGCISYHPDW